MPPPYKCFSKAEYIIAAFSKDAEFIAPGHPLMEAVVDEVIKRYSSEAKKGALFFDPSGKLIGRIWFFEVELRDGLGEIAGKRLFAFHERDGDIRQINPAVLWDLVPAREVSFQTQSETSIKPPISCAVEATNSYRDEIAVRRKRDAEIKLRYGLKSLEYLIAQSEAKLTDYEIRKAKGEDIPEIVIFREKKHREDLERKRKKLLETVEKEQHILPSEPKVLGVVQVLPIPQKDESISSDEEIERIGMEIAMKYEKKHGRNPEDVSALNLGYDIRSEDSKGNTRYIEVKARAKTGPVVLTANEWFMARRLQDEYWLYVVENAASDSPVLYTIQNPASKFRPEEVVGVVRYVIKDWKKEEIQ